MGLTSFYFGGAEGNLRSLSRLAAALRSAHAFSLTPPWRQKRVPDTFLLALRFPSNQNKKAVLCTTFLFWWSRGESNPCPKTYPRCFLRAQPIFKIPHPTRRQAGALGR